MKERILKGWTFIRVIYLLMGGFIIANAVADTQWLGIVMGGYIASMGLFGFGCAGGACYGGACEYPAQKKSVLESENADVKAD